MRWLRISALLVAVANALPSTLSSRDVVPACQVDLSGPFEFPHLILPIDSSRPDHAPGTSYHGRVSETVSTIFNFDIPARANHTMCTLVFLYPTQVQLSASPHTFDIDGNVAYSLKGDGQVIFSYLETTASLTTTYNNRPSVREGHQMVTTLVPGTANVIQNFPCPAGQAISVHMANAGTTELRYFQDYGNNPYVTWPDLQTRGWCVLTSKYANADSVFSSQCARRSRVPTRSIEMRPPSRPGKYRYLKESWSGRNNREGG